MADITDPELINYSNTVIRPSSDLMATLYYECDYLRQLAIADNDIAMTIQLRTPQIREVSDAMRDWVVNSATRINAWFNVGTPTPINTRFPNDSSPVIDGSPADGRPPITGADVHTIMTQVIQYQNWMKDAGFGGPGTGTSYDPMMNTIIVCGEDGNIPLQDAQVSTFISNRCGEITTDYQASSELKLTQVLAVAPNPRNPQV